MKPAAAFAVLMALVACRPAEQPAEPALPAAAPAEAPAQPTSYPAVEPIAPGQPGGFPDDRTPLSEAPFTATSAQGAANVVQTYFAHIGQKDYASAYALWSGDGEASGMTSEQFIAGFDRYYEYRGQSAGPSEIEGAAGSLFVTVPVQIYGRLKTGEEFHQYGEATLRRINDVPGSTESQRQWHIARIDTKPVP